VNTKIREKLKVRGPYNKPGTYHEPPRDTDKKLTCIRGPLGKPELFDEMKYLK